MVEKEEQTGQAQAEQPEEMTMDMNSDENIAGTNHLNEDVSDESAERRLSLDS